MREPAPTQRRAGVLGELALLFLRLGLTAFGGPAAHIALLEHEVVTRRGWMTREHFLDLLGATNLIPGPNSTEMAIHVGRERAGWPGLLVAGACFIVPAAALTAALAWSYVHFGTRPHAAGVFYGIKPVMIAIVLQALWGLGRTAVKSWGLGAILAGAVAASALGAHELLVLAVGGLLAMLGRWFKHRGAAAAPSAAAGLPALPGLPGAAAGAAKVGAGTAAVALASLPFSLAALFLFFLKVGAVLFGSGYVLLAFLRADLVERWRWLTEAQLLDAVAAGQVTPGPVFTTATFIGYLLGGAPGAVVATVGIFLPAFVFVAASGPLVPRLRRSPALAAFLDGVNAASLALMVVVAWHLLRAAIIDVPTALFGGASLLALFALRPNSVWLVLAGALGGWLLS
ncbi:MAG TPA: chromate efflux transporter [Polyangia bacterium]|nr:chromate efflux transporter [Polyangia bacterium]